MISAKERGLIKGAIRRVFSRSELRREVVESSRISHYDPERPRVTKWSKCSQCQTPTATYQIEVDHVDPIVPVDRSLEQMSWDEVINRVFCSKDNLTPVCRPCHAIKTKSENKARAQFRKGKK